MVRVISEFIGQKKELISNFSDAGLYFLGSIVQSILALIAQPIYSIYLSSSEFGILGYFDAVKSVLVPLFIFSIPSYYLMRYFKQSEAENKVLLFNLVFFLCCANLLFSLISYAAIYIYFDAMNVLIPFYPFSFFILAALILDNVKTFVMINYRIRKKAFAFFGFSAINSLLNFGIGLLFVAQFEWGAEGRMAAPIISSLLMLPFAVKIILNFSVVKFDFSIFVKAAKNVIPLVFAAYAFVPIASIDRFFLERLNNLSELGLYNIGLTIAGYVQLAYLALSSAVEPDIFKAVAEKNNKMLMKKAAVIYIPYLLFIILFIAFSGTIISILTAGRYVDAEKYANLTLLSIYFMGLYWFFDKIFIALEKPRMNLIVNVLGGFISIVTVYIGIQNFQFIGAVYGKIAASIVIVLTSFFLVLKNIRFNFKTVQ